MLVDRFVGLMSDVSSVSGVTLRGPFRGKEVYGRYENQIMSRGVVSVEALNAHGEWEPLVCGSEVEVVKALVVAKRLLDIGLQLRFATCSPATWIGRDKK